jgi:decaprenylphospho-beta-D-erythro-pentofuranosid-2-ulose 2-reductase
MRDAFGQPQTVVVLGGTSDIARATLEKLAKGRMRRVVLAGRDRAGLEVAALAIVEAGASEAEVVVFDATDVGGATGAVDACFAAAGGQVDLVLVAVGLLGNQGLDEDDAARTSEVLTVNLTWPAAALAALRARLLAQGQGRVVVLSSVAGVRVSRTNYTYGAAKAGLDAYALGFAESLRGTGTVVQVVRPGFVSTKMTEGMTPAPFATTADAVADSIIAGLSSNAPIIWSPKALRVVFTILARLPQAIWRRMPG